MDFRKLRKRVVGILMDPIGEWRVIASERGDVASLYKNYIMPIAAIPAISLFLGLGVIGRPFSGKLGLATALWAAIGVYVSQLVIVFVAALVIEKLAPRFKSSGSIEDALKLVAYASTPAWVSGVLYAFFYFAMLALGGAIYSIYLFYLGLPALMKTQPDNVVPYTLVSVITLLVLYSVFATLRWAIGMPSYVL